MKRIIIITVFLISQFGSQAQLSDVDLKEIINTINTQKTANTKDILTTLFRTGIDNLLGKEHSFVLNSSFYGIDSIFRGKNAQKLTFVQERKLRQESFNISLTGDSVNNITKFSGSFTIALINKKDITLNSMDKADLNFLKNKSLLISILEKAMIAVFAVKHSNLYDDKDTLKVVTESWRDANRKEDFSNLHPYLKEALRSSELIDIALAMKANILNAGTTVFQRNEIEEALNSLVDGKNLLHEAFKMMCKKYSRKPLWTINPVAAYDNVNKQGEYSFASEFTVGIGSNPARKPWELEIKSQFKIANDTSVKKTNYDNKPFFLSIGLNKVLIETNDNEPKMEFKFFTQYDHQFGNVPPGSKAGVFTLNSTLRVNVFKSMWLPITLKYDPDNNNFLGLFSITANLGN